MIVDIDVTMMNNVYGYACIFQNTTDKLTGLCTNAQNVNDAAGFALLEAVNFVRDKSTGTGTELEIWFYHMTDNRFSVENSIYADEIDRLESIKINNIGVYEKNFTANMSKRYDAVHNMAISSALKHKKVSIGLQKKTKLKKMKIDTD